MMCVRHCFKARASAYIFTMFRSRHHLRVQQTMGSSLSTPKDDPQVQAHIQRLIAENPVIAFTKITCPYCASTKLILKQKGVQHLCIDVDITCQ